MSTTTPDTTDSLDSFGLVGTRLDGKFEIDAVVAEGGFGVVYRATHISLRRPVAVKVLKVPPELNDAARRLFLDRFAKEAQTIAALDHPAIVRVIDFGASLMPRGEAAPWMVLEWLTGTTLDDDLESRRGQGGRSPAECLALIRPVFEALAYAHEEGIVHRDIKPPNLMLVTNKRGERTVRVLDFGIAKVMTDEDGTTSGHTATQTQQRAFSLFYAAPEQLSGTRTGPWTDVYALALVLTEMLTDCSAYEGADVQDVYVEILSPRRPTPAKRGFNAGVWESVLARAVSIKPNERFATAREFLAALEASVPASVRAPSVMPAAPAQIAPTQEVDTLDHAKTIRDTAPAAGAGRGRSAFVFGVAAIVLLGLLVGTASYMAASRQGAPSAQAAHGPPVVPAAMTTAAAVTASPVQQVLPPTVEPRADGGVVVGAGVVAAPLRSPVVARPAVGRGGQRVVAAPTPRVVPAAAVIPAVAAPAAPTPVTGHERVIAE